MQTFFFRILLIFLLSSPAAVYSQVRTDSSDNSGDTITMQTDSFSSVPDSTDVSEAHMQTYTSMDSMYMPVKDNSYLNTFTLREVSSANIKKYLADRDYEYANDPEYWKKDKTDNETGPSLFSRLLGNKVLQWFLFLLVISVVVYGIYQLARENNFRWFSRPGEESLESESDSLVRGPVNYDEAISKYQAEGNYRFAVRYLFLRLVNTAADKNIIQIRDSSTNTEIGRAFGQHPLAPQYRYLATAYEYIYFGEFSINKETFDLLKEKFEVFQQKLSA